MENKFNLKFFIVDNLEYVSFTVPIFVMLTAGALLGEAYGNIKLSQMFSLKKLINKNENFICGINKTHNITFDWNNLNLFQFLLWID